MIELTCSVIPPGRWRSLFAIGATAPALAGRVWSHDQSRKTLYMTNADSVTWVGKAK